MSDSYSHLLGTHWRNKRSGHEYRVTQVRPNVGTVWLSASTKGGRSGWKYAPHLPFDYERILDDGGTET